MARPDMNSEAARHVIIPIKMVLILILKSYVLNISKLFDAINILPIVKIKPIREATILAITQARYFPVISSLAFTGKVSNVSRVPFSFSTAVADDKVFPF